MTTTAKVDDNRSTSTVLVLRLAGPLQSWGDHRALLNRRSTAALPTKSGVIGLICAATGHDRELPLGPYADLRLGVRADQPGTLLRDYRTLSDYRGRDLLGVRVNGKGVQQASGKATAVTERFYLQDAVFLAALQGDPELLAGINSALRAPAYALSLGRRACPPTLPLTLGLRHDTTLDQVLTTEPWQAADHHQRRHTRTATVQLTAVIEDPTGTDTVPDQPVSYSLDGRRHTTRTVRHTHIPLPTGHTPQAPVEHDPLSLLGW